MDAPWIRTEILGHLSLGAEIAGQMTGNSGFDRQLRACFNTW
jgi:hypothetical protein